MFIGRTSCECNKRYTQFCGDHFIGAIMLTLQTLEKYVVSIHQLALAIDKRVIALESKERRKTVRAKRPVQHRKSDMAIGECCNGMLL